uniref:HAT C-terminal dimerisation domain-containing protein n=1 Tax=Lactuca sativa TaxID=4236 RepID=A0A9R1UH85_LACSA|nr:hypothetical protein LSAT_V11C900485060 [Lactuca sativa]
MTLPNDIISALEILDCVKVVDCYPNTFITYNILLTIHVTIASAEKSFSKLKLLKNYLRSLTSQEMLNGLAMLCIDKHMLDKIDLDRLKSVSEGFQYKVKKSTKDMFEVVSYMDNYDWRIRATKHNTTDTIQVRDPEESFLRLPLYCYNFKKKNPWTVTHIKTSDATNLNIFFMTISCAVQAFQRCLHPIIIIDGAHLKGKYLGTSF